MFYALAPVGLYFGLISYNGKVSAGIVMDPKIKAEPKGLAQCWKPAFEELYEGSHFNTLYPILSKMIT